MPNSARQAAAFETPSTLVWFRQDLRLADNPALQAAVKTGGPLACVFVFDDAAHGAWAPGAASRWWLHHALGALSAELAARGQRLILRRGSAQAVIPRLAAEINANAVFWNRRYDPAPQAVDQDVKATLKARGVVAESFNAQMLVEPWTLKTGAGGPFKVFSPFARAARAAGIHGFAAPAPASLPPAPDTPSDHLTDWGLLPTKPDWAGGLRAAWTPGEKGAHARLTAFLTDGIAGYAANRNRMDLPSTSRLSPHLHWGEISPFSAWRAASEAAAADARLAKDAEVFGNELLWREFSHHLLATSPDLPEKNWKPAFDDFPWQDAGGAQAEAWRRGRTGYPIVDAAMRELWVTGFMHNRARMVAASFLIKHLMVHWRAGEAWFWDTLVDADLANNAASWQWVAGSGADASPFFRIFNPVSQGETYDPQGAYVRRWLPALARLPDRFIHSPWTAPALVLREAGVRLDETYPNPIVDHAQARQRALNAFQSLQSTG
jgi:deoxyribodipyrimidine photo-lyase